MTIKQPTLRRGVAFTGPPRTLPWRRRFRFEGFTAVSVILALSVIMVTLAAILTVLSRLLFVNGTFSLAPVQEAFEKTDILTPLLNSTIVVLSSAVLAVVFGGLLAWVNERTDARMGLFADIAPLAPFLMPPIAGTIGFILLFSPQVGYANQAWEWFLGLFGVVDPAPFLDAYSWGGLIAIFTVYGIPFTYMMIAPALRMMDSSLEEASKIFGARPLRTVFRVTIPAVLPAVGAGAFLWIWIAFSMVEIPLVLAAPTGIDLLAPQIVQLMKFSYPPNEAGAIALSGIITVIVLLMWFIQTRILRSGRNATVGAKGAKTQSVKLGRFRGVARAFILLYVGMTTVVPGLALMYVALQGAWKPELTLAGLSLDTFGKMLAKPQVVTGLTNSFMLATVSATLVILVAAIIALFVARQRGIGGRLVDAAVKLPGTVGGLIIVVGILLLFTGAPFWLGGTVMILLIALVLLAIPNASVAADAAVAGVGESLSEASRISGASETRTFRRVVLPLLIPGLIGTWASVFVRSLSDVTASSLLAGTANPVIGFQILEESRYGSFASTAALCLILAVVSAATILLAIWFGRWTSRWTQTDHRQRRVRTEQKASR